MSPAAVGAAEPTGDRPALADLLPEPAVHPLPQALARWRDRGDRGDYLDRLESFPLGAPIHATFPVRVYAGGEDAPEVWREAVRTAIADWGEYFPLAIVDRPDRAEVRFAAARPPLRVANGRPRAAAARTTCDWTLHDRPDGTTVLARRCAIALDPSLRAPLALGAARHELGHALGIWGHSDDPGDVLYASQVPDPPPLSPRDWNTLHRLYQQPTRLGWPLSDAAIARLRGTAPEAVDRLD